MPGVTPQPMIAVADVQRSSRFYQQLLGADSGHGGDEYEQLLVDGELVMQLHAAEIEHHHGAIGEPGAPVGGGVVLWFAAQAFDAAVQRIRESGAEIVTDVAVNPNSGRREVWLRDPDGYLIVVAEPF
ncbi:MAG: VOC family protein [Solirubrobacteraceae bacterium]